MKTWIDEVEARAEAATPGPWEQWLGHTQVFTGPSTENTRRIYKPAGTPIADSGDNMAECEPQEIVNAQFIASARTDVPRLCKALRMTLDAAVCTCGVRGSMFGHDDKDETCPATVAERIRKGDF